MVNAKFNFAAAGEIRFGCGRVAEAGAIAAAWGRKALVVAGRNPERARPIIDSLKKAGVETSLFSVAGEPTVRSVAAGAAAAREAGAELVAGFGGGSALDAAKAIAVLAANPGEPLDYLEVIGRGKPLQRPGLPCLAVPTTAGTGAEVTRNSVLASEEHRVKASLRSPLLLPRCAVVDPELTRSLPPDQTAACGMDALTQLIEAYLSRRANPLTDALCTEAIPRTARALPRAFERGEDLHARTEMSLAALFSGLALANAGLGAVHGVAGPFGGLFRAPHGAVCGALLPHVFRANLAAVRARAPGSPMTLRFDRIARWLVGDPEATAEDGAAWIEQLVRKLGLPPLRAYGCGPEDLPELAAKARRASSMKANPIELTDRELMGLLEAAL